MENTFGGVRKRGTKNSLVLMHGKEKEKGRGEGGESRGGGGGVEVEEKKVSWEFYHPDKWYDHYKNFGENEVNDKSV
uniref:Uncharacterized protein n=1 Tax=Vespula pensylvanica TaxID=30213 RepID=A0A834UG01_VESPE|nr:hypothetical protein H0235_000321 [Vespula pensylvanica]